MAEFRKPSAPFTPLSRPRSLNDMAYENIKNGILGGQMAPGEVYSELELARGLGTSRTPVREALLKLAAENFILFHPKKGISVKHFSRKDIENSFELRQVIEEAALKKITGRLSAGQIQAVRDLIQEQEESIRDGCDERLFLEIDRSFHLFLVEAAGNRLMVRTYNQLRDYLTLSARQALLRKGRAQEVIEEHRKILEALARQDLREAREELKNHLTNSRWTALAQREEETGR